MKERPVVTGEIYTIEITSLTSSGDGVGRIDGFAIFVGKALPGEVVQAKVFQVKKRFARAKLISIIHRSDHRQKPPCKFFGKCGGCQIMHLDYGEQLKVKHHKVVEAFERIGHLENIPIDECVPSPQQTHYRNKVMMPVVYNRCNQKIGFYGKGTHQVIDIDSCLIHNDLGNQVLHTIRQIVTPSNHEVEQIVIKTSIHTQQVLVILISSLIKSQELENLAKEIIVECPWVQGILQNIPPHNGKSTFGKKWKTLAGKPRIEEKLCGLVFEISGASFFQVNTFQAEQLYQDVIKAAAINSSSVVLDAYCGVGTLSLIASKHAKYVYGIEVVPEAIRDANVNAEKNGIQNCTFECGLTEHLIEKYTHVDVVFLNPPRQGCDERVINCLLSVSPEKIVYVSCDPTTLARDLALLRKGYTIDFVRPYDMFPQTTHVETVAILHATKHQ
ncbi:MAG: 23S rRNA (uracil(1939)-C(5))-methyltransferase RlmD [Chlamydiota bacterium]